MSSLAILWGLPPFCPMTPTSQLPGDSLSWVTLDSILPTASDTFLFYPRLQIPLCDTHTALMALCGGSAS